MTTKDPATILKELERLWHGMLETISQLDVACRRHQEADVAPQLRGLFEISSSAFAMHLAMSAHRKGHLGIMACLYGICWDYNQSLWHLLRPHSQYGNKETRCKLIVSFPDPSMINDEEEVSSSLELSRRTFSQSLPENENLVCLKCRNEALRFISSFPGVDSGNQPKFYHLNPSWIGQLLTNGIPYVYVPFFGPG